MVNSKIVMRRALFHYLHSVRPNTKVIYVKDLEKKENVIGQYSFYPSSGKEKIRLDSVKGRENATLSHEVAHAVTTGVDYHNRTFKKREYDISLAAAVYTARKIPNVDRLSDTAVKKIIKKSLH